MDAMAAGGGASSSPAAGAAAAATLRSDAVVAAARRTAATTATLGARGAATASRPAAPPPEVHILGEIGGGTGFGDGVSVCCKWSVEAGDHWEWLAGQRSGQTHTSEPEDGSAFVPWSHPLDVHYVAGSLHGWPRLHVQVFSLDAYGRLELQGYGFGAIPAATGAWHMQPTVVHRRGRRTVAGVGAAAVEMRWQ